MNTKIILPSLLLLINMTGFCRVWTVGSAHNTFVRNNFSIDLGDSVKFDLGPTHDASEVDKATWDAKGNTPIANGFKTLLEEDLCCRHS